MVSVNLDSNASYGLLPEVKEALYSTLEESPLNPSSIHSGGQRGRALIEEARDKLRAALGLSKEYRIVFTSGATEANNTAVMMAGYKLLAAKNSGGRGSITVSSFEHPSVLEPVRKLAKLGVVTHEASPSSALSYISEETILLSLMAANNETGEIFDVGSIFRKAREIAPTALIHTDAVQVLGKIDINWNHLGADLISLSGHKIGALPGVGALIVKEGSSSHEPLLLGGPQETRWRAGTENILGIVSFGIAAQLLSLTLARRIETMRRTRSIIESELVEGVPDLQFNTPRDRSLTNTLNIRIPGVRADDLVVALDLEGVLISSGAACASGKPEPSHVLLAMGLKPHEARECIRISVGAALPESTAREAAQRIINTIARLRSVKDTLCVGGSR